mmetsp:Transcript_18465/g.65353  ORF Transcript_18465/g.65353 Transcript_18465/m.65353 type:complete len:222 (-) Transcript_18465:859-1524(-)
MQSPTGSAMSRKSWCPRLPMVNVVHAQRENGSVPQRVTTTLVGSGTTLFGSAEPRANAARRLRRMPAVICSSLSSSAARARRPVRNATRTASPQVDSLLNSQGQCDGVPTGARPPVRSGPGRVPGGSTIHTADVRGDQNARGKVSTTLFMTAQPRRSMAASFVSGRGGSNRTSPCFNTPSGSVTTTLRALNTTRLSPAKQRTSSPNGSTPAPARCSLRTML